MISKIEAATLNRKIREVREAEELLNRCHQGYSNHNVEHGHEVLKAAKKNLNDFVKSITEE